MSHGYRAHDAARMVEEPPKATVRSEFARDCLGERFARLYALTRRGEMQEFGSYISPLEYAWYLTTV